MRNCSSAGALMFKWAESAHKLAQIEKIMAPKREQIKYIKANIGQTLRELE